MWYKVDVRKSFAMKCAIIFQNDGEIEGLFYKYINILLTY